MQILEKFFGKFPTKSPTKSPQKLGLQYKGGGFTFGLGDSDIIGTNDLYYKLYRKSTDIKWAVEKRQSSVGKDGFFLEKNGERIEHKEIENIFKNFRLLKSKIVRDLDISGGAFIYPVKNSLGGLYELQILDPRSMRIIANKYGEILKYMQQIGASMVEFEADEVFYLTDTIDPDNEILGLSKIESLIYDVMGDDEAMKSNYAFFKNNAVPNSIVILEDNISEDEYKSVIAQMKAQFSGGANRHKVSTNTGIKEIKTIGQSNKDMEFIALRQFTTDKVCAGLSVPKTILGYHDGVNYSTADNHYRTFIEETIRPLEDLIAEKITEIIAKFFPNENIRFCFVDDRDFDRTAKIDEYTKMLADGIITINEVRTEMGYTPFDIKNACEPLLGVQTEKVKNAVQLLQNGVITINEFREEIGMPPLADENAKKSIIKQGFEFVEDIGTAELLPDNQPPAE